MFAAEARSFPPDLMPLLHRPRRQPSNQLAREEQVQNDDRQHGQAKRRKNGVPVADKLAEELLCTEGDGLGRLTWRQDEREPEVVPDWDHRKHRNSSYRGRDKRQDKPEDAV